MQLEIFFSEYARKSTKKHDKREPVLFKEEISWSEKNVSL